MYKKDLIGLAQYWIPILILTDIDTIGLQGIGFFFFFNQY